MQTNPNILDAYKAFSAEGTDTSKTLWTNSSDAVRIVVTSATFTVKGGASDGAISLYGGTVAASKLIASVFVKAGETQHVHLNLDQPHVLPGATDVILSNTTGADYKAVVRGYLAQVTNKVFAT